MQVGNPAGHTFGDAHMTTSNDFHPPPALARSTRRPAADFREYVLAYSRAQRANIGLIFAGVAVVIGGALNLHGTAAIFVVALGLGLAAGGAGGLLIAAGAHAAFTRHLGTYETQTYTTPPAAPTVRPFVPSTNPTNIRAGRFQLPAATWAALFNAAEANGGRLTRDGAAKALPRALYRDWQTTADELRRLDIIDADGMVTAAGWQFARRDLSPYPIGAKSAAGAQSTHARRTHDPHGDEAMA